MEKLIGWDEDFNPITRPLTPEEHADLVAAVLA